MQTFTPTQLHQNPAKVFRAADKDGSVLIKHDRYQDVEFILTAKGKADNQAQRKRNYEVAASAEAQAHGCAVLELDK